MTRDEFYEILDDNSKNKGTTPVPVVGTTEPRTIPEPQNNTIKKKVVYRTPTTRNKTYRIIMIVATIIFVVAVAIVIMGLFRRPPQRPMPNSNTPQGQTPPSNQQPSNQNEPLGPNGERPGQVGPNGEQPPTR